MSVTKAIREEIHEIDDRMDQLKGRKARLIEALRILAPEERENGRQRVVGRSSEEWQRIVLEGAAALRRFTVAELAEHQDVDAAGCYRPIKRLVDDGALRPVEGATAARNATIYEVVDAADG